MDFSSISLTQKPRLTFSELSPNFLLLLILLLLLLVHVSISMAVSNRMIDAESTSSQKEMRGEGIEEEGADDPNSSLIPSLNSSDDLLIRTGTKWTAVAHIISAVIGAGVLSLAWSVAQLGWIMGPLCIIIFAAMTLISSALLADIYRHPNPEHGPTRNRSFMDATKLYMGRKHQLALGVMAQISLYGSPIAYTIAAASSVRAVLKAICYHFEGHQALCEYEDSLYMLLFGLVQILVSQTPNFHSMRWLSISATVMSFSYSFIGLGLGLAKVIENGTIKGSMTGVPGSDLSSKLMAAFTALGDIAYSYPFPLVFLEIEDTLKSPPPENKTMKAATRAAISIATFFYLSCGCMGYAAFGDDTPGNLLTGFGFYEPYWLVGFANACVVLHLVGGYQVYTQAAFGTAERWFAEKFPNSWMLDNSHSFKFPLLSTLGTNFFRLSFRTAYVASVTGISIFFPYFNSVLGVSGSVFFWPLVAYFPAEMYLVQMRIRAWSRQWILLRAFSILGIVITVLGTIGSLEELISAKLSSEQSQFGTVSVPS